MNISEDQEVALDVEKDFLRRNEAARYVRETYGVPCALRTLAKLASIGGGPVFYRFGGVPLYKKSDLDFWVAEKIRGPMRSTSQGD